LQQRGGAVLLKVLAQPGASRDAVKGIHGDALKVTVTAPPEKGRANRALEKVVAENLGIRASQVQVQAGASSRSKWLRLEGVTLEDVRKRLATCVGVAPGENDAG
jgi:uncharacterized protein (TIGR00251 family)